MTNTEIRELMTRWPEGAATVPVEREDLLRLLGDSDALRLKRAETVEESPTLHESLDVEHETIPVEVDLSEQAVPELVEPEETKS